MIWQENLVHTQPKIPLCIIPYQCQPFLDMRVSTDRSAIGMASYYRQIIEDFGFDSRSWLPITSCLVLSLESKV